MHLLGTIFSSGLIHIWNMSPSATEWFINVFLIVLGQQLSSMAQKNKPFKPQNTCQ